MTQIIVPTLGESVSEATVATWLKKEGDTVALDEPLVELETDKVTLEVNSPAAGVISSIKVQEGEDVEVGALLGEIGGEGAAATPVPKVETTPTPVVAASAEDRRRNSGTRRCGVSGVRRDPVRSNGSPDRTGSNGQRGRQDPPQDERRSDSTGRRARPFGRCSGSARSSGRFGHARTLETTCRDGSPRRRSYSLLQRPTRT